MNHIVAFVPFAITVSLQLLIHGAVCAISTLSSTITRNICGFFHGVVPVQYQHDIQIHLWPMRPRFEADMASNCTILQRDALCDVRVFTDDHVCQKGTCANSATFANSRARFNNCRWMHSWHRRSQSQHIQCPYQHSSHVLLKKALKQPFCARESWNAARREGGHGESESSASLIIPDLRVLGNCKLPLRGVRLR